MNHLTFKIGNPIKFCKENVLNFSIAFLAFGVAFAIESSHLSWELSHKIFHDDSYYYMQTALNYVNYGNMTFDGVTTTNGYHPLWMWLLIVTMLIFKLIGVDPSQKMVIELVLFFGGTFLFLTVSQIISTVKGVTIVNKITLSALIVLISWPFFFNGMETGIAILSFAHIVITLVEKDGIKTNSSLILFLFSVCCLVLSRLDAIAILPAIIIASYFRFGKKVALLALFLSLIAILLAVLQSYMAIGEFAYMPMSSTVKRWWADNILNEQLAVCLNDKTLFRCYFSLFLTRVLSAMYMFSDQLNMIWAFQWPQIIYASSSIFPSNFIAKINLLIIFIMMSIYIYIKYTSISHMAAIISIGLIFSGLFLFLTSFLISFQVRSFSWYLWSCLPFLFLSIVNVKIFRTSVVSVSIVIILLIGTYKVIFKSGSSDWGKAYQSVAEVINSDADLRIGGTWAAGHIGFSTNGKIVNLEGLISGSEIHVANENHQLARYIIDNELDFLIYNSKIPNSNSGVNFFELVRVEPLLALKPCLTEMQVFDNGYDVRIDLYKINKFCTHKLDL